MRSWITRAWEFVSRVWRPRYRLEVSQEEPNFYASRTIYLLGEGASTWAATFECPCGCGGAVWLNLLRGPNRPRWEIIWHRSGDFSIAPSVWRVGGCRSHFIVRHSRIISCHSGRHLEERL